MAAASSLSVSGSTVTGSFVIQSFTPAAVGSTPAAAARRASRSVKMPSSHGPSTTTAEPTRPFTIVSAASATVAVGATENTLPLIRSPKRVTRAAPAGVDVAAGGARHFGQFPIQLPPQRARPRLDAGPIPPEQLEGGLVELIHRLVGGHGVSDLVECLHGLQKLLGHVSHGKVLLARWGGGS